MQVIHQKLTRDYEEQKKIKNKLKYVQYKSK